MPVHSPLGTSVKCEGSLAQDASAQSQLTQGRLSMQNGSSGGWSSQLEAGDCELATSGVADRRALGGRGGRAPGEREGCRNSGDEACRASAPKILPRLAAQLRPQPMSAPRRPFKDCVDWLKQMGFREPDHSIRRCS